MLWIKEHGDEYTYYNSCGVEYGRIYMMKVGTDRTEWAAYSYLDDGRDQRRVGFYITKEDAQEAVEKFVTENNKSVVRKIFDGFKNFLKENLLTYSLWRANVTPLMLLMLPFFAAIDLMALGGILIALVFVILPLLVYERYRTGP